jgi:hypothetical protein
MTDIYHCWYTQVCLLSHSSKSSMRCSPRTWITFTAKCLPNGFGDTSVLTLVVMSASARIRSTLPGAVTSHILEVKVHLGIREDFGSAFEYRQFSCIRGFIYSLDGEHLHKAGFCCHTMGKIPNSAMAEYHCYAVQIIKRKQGNKHFDWTKRL